MRRLINGEEVEELKSAIELKVLTKCPSKWLLIDTETGEVYIGTNKTERFKSWRKLNNC